MTAQIRLIARNARKLPDAVGVHMLRVVSTDPRMAPVFPTARAGSLVLAMIVQS